jgi:hypothetical protein
MACISIHYLRKPVQAHVVPARPDGTTTMTVRGINQQSVEFDRVVFKRKADRGR